MSESKRSNQEKILAAASELFVEGGVSALSVRAIAAKAGISTIGIYSHFQGKQGILDALYIEGFELVYEAMAAVPTNASHQQVLGSVDSYLNVATNHEGHYRLIFGEVDTGYLPSEHAIAARDKAFGRLIEIGASALPADASRADAMQLALDIWAVIHGYVSIFHHAMRDNSVNMDWRNSVKNAVLRLLETT